MGGRRGRRAGGRKGARGRKAVLGHAQKVFGGLAKSFLALPSLFEIAAGTRHRLDAMTLIHSAYGYIDVALFGILSSSTGSGGSRSVYTAADD